MAWWFGYGRAGALGYGAAIIPDMFYGGVKLFLPVSPVVVGVDIGTLWLTSVVAFLSGVGILGRAIATAMDESPIPNSLSPSWKRWGHRGR